MKTIRVITLKDHDYEAKSRKAGDEYDADPKFIALLTGMGRVKVLTVDATPMPPELGTYKRRDMRAQK